MRILMLLESDFPPDVRVENEAISLAGAGHEVLIACYSHRRDFKVNQNLPYTIHKTYIPSIIYKSSVGALRLGIYFNFWRKILRRISKLYAFDAIHVHDLPLARVGCEFSQAHHIPFTLDLHENWPALLDMSTHTKSLMGRVLSSGRQWRQYERKYVSLADHVVVVVEEARQRIAALGADISRIHVVSNTIDPRYFSFPREEKDPSYITMVYGGGINYHRGLQTVIEALQYLPEKFPNIRLWIIGPGSYTDTLKQLTSERSVEQYVTFYDRMPLQQLLQYICRADVALIPHLKSPHTDSTIPHKLFQYMYAGVPIIASDCAPLQRIIEETSTGLCFRNQDPRSFATTAERLLNDREFLAKIPENGKKWVEGKYNWHNDARILNAIYQLP